MANPGNYQVGDELYRTAFASVCLATPLNAAHSSAHSTFVIKIFDSAGSGMDDPALSGLDSKRAAAFLNGVKTQQQVAASGKYWAPIHESGNVDGKPFYVTSYYPRTAQKLLSGRVILDPFGLHEIMQSIVLGLVELKKTCGRAHGNLKPSNVLIGGQGRVTEGKFVLTDPAPGPCNGNDAEAEDLRAIGGLLYHLVMQRPALTTTWPVAESEQWARLGGRGRAWRQLCNDLLSFDPAERKTLADLERALRKLVPIKVPVGKIAAGVAIFGAIAGTAGWIASRWEQNARAELVAAQDQWFSVLQDPARADVFEADPVLRDVLADDRSHQAVFQVALNTEGWAALKPAIMRQITEAREISRNSHRKWIEAFKKDAADASDKIAVFRNRGWTIPDRYAKVPTLDDNPPAQSIFDGANQLHDLRLRLAGNDPSARWIEFEHKLDQLHGTTDCYLCRFADLLNKTAAGAISLSDQSWIATPALQRSEGLAANLLAKGKVDFDAGRFTAEQPDINLNNPALPDIERWLGTVNLYVRVPDAGKTLAADCAKEFEEQIGRGLKKNPDQWPKSTTQEFVDAKNKIDQACLALANGNFLEKDLRLSDENRGALYDKKNEIRQQIAALRLKYYVVPANPAEFVASLAELNVKDARLKSIWDKNKADLAGKKPGEIPISQFEERKLQIQSLQKLLKSLDDFAPTPPLLDSYQTIAVARRTEDFEPLLARVGDGSSLTAGQIESLAADTARASGNYAQWSNQVKDLARDFGTPPGNNQILEYTRFPDQAWRDATDPQVRDFWQTQVLSTAGRFNVLLGRFLGRLDQLRAVQTDDLRVVTELTTRTNPKSPPEILVAAWRRLASEGQLARPASIGGLSQEGVIRTNLADVKSAIDRKELLAAGSISNDLQLELARGPLRWCDAVKTANAPADVHAAMAVAMQFNLNFAIDGHAIAQPGKVVSAPALTAHSGDLGPAPYYNVALALAQDAIAAKDNAIAPSRLDALMNAAAQLAPGKSDFSPLVRWLQNARVTYGDGLRLQAEALLTDSLFCFPPAQQPNLLDQVIAASARLKDKQPQQGLALLKGFLPADSSALPEPFRAKFARQLFDLGNLLAADVPSQKDAYMQSMRLGNKDAMAAAMKIDSIDKAGMTRELKNLADAGNVDAQVQLAKIYDTGWGGALAVNRDEARRYYTLADYRQNAEAHEWLKNNPVQVASPVVTPPPPGPVVVRPPEPPPSGNPPPAGPVVSNPPDQPVMTTPPKRRPRAGN